MSEISSTVAARIANDVYLLVIDNPKVGFNKIRKRQGAIMDFGDESMISGKTGGPGFIKSRSGFGICSIGKGNYKGHAFIVMRGTKFLGDWLTNFNMGTSRSAYGQSIHDGFHQAFLSMRDQLMAFVSSLSTQGVHTVHCVGHSLGGGLATVCAEYILSTTSFKPYLYTFGAPRVGMQTFADMLSSNLTPEKMYRVYHRTDIVPCIPFWPYVHAPTLLHNSYDYFQPSPGVFPSAEWHDMDLYASTVGNKKWSSLRGLREKNYNGKNIEKWLNEKQAISFSVTNLDWLDKSINYVVSKCLSAVGGALTLASAGTFTLMDRLAIILKKGINLASNLSTLVILLIRKVMSILGMKPVLDKADITYLFIRNIFMRLSQKVSTYCQQALDQVLVGGKAV